MLVSLKNLIDIPIMSLQTGSELARTVSPVIDPRQLTIIAFYVEGPSITYRPCVLHPSDIREIGDVGFIIDSDSKLMSLDGLVRLNEVIDFSFNILGLRVIDQNKRKLGKVSGYSIETEGFTIQQIYTEQSLLRSVSTAANTIHRSQIITVNDKEIVVQSPTVKEELQQVASSARSFANPFRGTSVQSD
jgi:uncharacterized protein YrrD